MCYFFFATISCLISLTALAEPNLADESAVNQAVTIGKRVLHWMEIENKKYPSAPIHGSSATTRGMGISIEEPDYLSAKLIREVLELDLLKIPPELKKLLLSGQDIPETLPIPLATFQNWSATFIYHYERANRLKFLVSYQAYYEDQAKFDLRSYYQLEKETLTSAKLANFFSLDLKEQEHLKKLLIAECASHTPIIESCDLEFTTAFVHGELPRFFKKHHELSRKVWNSYFTISDADRNANVSASDNPKFLLQINFQIPLVEKMKSLIQKNIEDEWHIQVHFSNLSTAPFLVFEDGAVPHVNQVGGNTITLDANTPTDEYSVQWTLRHEFGHVLGFKDCYLEFYDHVEKQFVNYQLDLTDIMCSEAGNFTAHHSSELRRVYLPN